jgi:predicted RNA methylase
VGDPVAATLLALVGDVAAQHVLDLACGQGRVSRALACRAVDQVAEPEPSGDWLAREPGRDPVPVYLVVRSRRS